MQQIYFDNGSTSFPKAPGVGEAIASLIERGAYNINRGGYEGAYEVADMVLDTREQLCSLFHFGPSSHVVFTPSITYSLNYIIKGLLRPGRPCGRSASPWSTTRMTAAPGASWSGPGRGRRRAAPADRRGRAGPRGERTALYPPPGTRAVVLTPRLQPVAGAVLPIAEGRRSSAARRGPGVPGGRGPDGRRTPHRHGDHAAHRRACALPGHKGLCWAPRGSGAMLLSEGLGWGSWSPLVSGGTGSRLRLRAGHAPLPARQVRGGHPEPAGHRRPPRRFAVFEGIRHGEHRTARTGHLPAVFGWGAAAAQHPRGGQAGYGQAGRHRLPGF